MYPREKSQMLIVVGFAVGHCYATDIHHLIEIVTTEQKKTEDEKKELLDVLEYAKDFGIQEHFSNSDIQILVSAIKYEI
jgi:hypothetical protein